MNIYLVLISLFSATLVFAADVSAPQGVTLTLYDNGMAFISELRRATLAQGENELTVRNLPKRLDPSTVHILPVKAEDAVTWIDQHFENDTVDIEHLWQRYLHKNIQIKLGETTYSGELISIPDVNAPLLQLADGSVVTLSASDRWDEVIFPNAAKDAYLESTLVTRLASTKDQIQNVRLSYIAYGLSWQANYEVILAPNGQEAHVAYRVALANQSGGDFKNARVKLVATDKAGETSTGYAYGSSVQAAELASKNLAGTFAYDVPQSVNLDDGETKYIQIASADKVSVQRFYVYDGVKFDRFPRNRRNDWNYGTEYNTVVQTCLEIAPDDKNNISPAWSPGRLQLYQERDDGAVDLLGQNFVQTTSTGTSVFVTVGPARGLQGERERTGYTEVKPLHEYEETFEIRLSNSSDETAEVRVVEHLYRWSDYEIVKADAEYAATGPQTIEFKTELKSGGKRSIHYTVRYRW